MNAVKGTTVTIRRSFIGASCVVSTALVAAMFVAPSAHADSLFGDNHVSADDISTALTTTEQVAPGLLLESDASDHLTLPTSPSDPITLGTGGSSLTLTLPNAADAQDAVTLDNGVVTYPSSGYSANSISTNDGAVQFVTTITSPKADTRYEYTLGLAPGQRLELFAGGASVINADGTTGYDIASPWAIDSRGTEVPTHYEVAGNVLTQVVEHTANSNVQYPVVADPMANPYGRHSYCNKFKSTWKTAANCTPGRYVGPKQAEADRLCGQRALAAGLSAAIIESARAFLKTPPPEALVGVALVGTLTFGGELIQCYVEKS